MSEEVIMQIASAIGESPQLLDKEGESDDEGIESMTYIINGNLFKAHESLPLDWASELSDPAND